MTVIDTRLPGLLKGDKPLFGIFVGLASPAVVEMCGHAGFDFVIIDNEHGPASIETTEHLIRAARCATSFRSCERSSPRYCAFSISVPLRFRCRR